MPPAQNLPTLSGAEETKTSGGSPAATALAKAASSLLGTKFTVSHGYLACSRVSADLNAATSLGRWLNVHTLIVVGACEAPAEIAVSGWDVVRPGWMYSRPATAPSLPPRPR